MKGGREDAASTVLLLGGERKDEIKGYEREHALLLTKGRDYAPGESLTHGCAYFLPKRTARHPCRPTERSPGFSLCHGWIPG